MIRLRAGHRRRRCLSRANTQFRWPLCLGGGGGGSSTTIIIDDDDDPANHPALSSLDEEARFAERARL